jgi:hypothetical protein
MNRPPYLFCTACDNLKNKAAGIKDQRVPCEICLPLLLRFEPASVGFLDGFAFNFVQGDGGGN